jgi:hypothetical protein
MDDTLKALDQVAISRLWLQGAMSSALKDGGKPVGNWYVNNNYGKNTTVHTVSLVNTSMSYMGETVEFAICPSSTRMPLGRLLRLWP